MKKFLPQLENKMLMAFVAAAESGNFLQAGILLNKSKTTISRWINELEIILGYTLFDKRANGSVLDINSNGKLLLPKVKMFLLSLQKLEKFSFALNNNKEPAAIRLAFNQLIPEEAIADVVLKLKKEFPAVEIHIVHADLFDVEFTLNSNKADFVLGLQCVEIYNNINAQVVGDIQMMLVADTAHPLAKEQQVNSLSLSSETVIYPSLQGKVDDERYHFLPYSEMMLTTDYYSCVKLAEKGLGITYIPDHMAINSILTKKLKEVKVDKNEVNNIHSLMLYYRADYRYFAISAILSSGLKEWFGYH
ncbi:LysR family transcriptional regulator [Arsenophonus nasoniae]|uniref:LysR family transcriptional regulator n=1 Tax=Arsenophonus nasoniae TaxID=638 RepID=UPI0038791C22